MEESMFVGSVIRPARGTGQLATIPAATEVQRPRSGESLWLHEIALDAA